MTGFPSNTTFASLVEEIIGGLQAHTFAPDQMTVLTDDVTATDTRMRVEDIAEVSKGVIEIGNELVYVRAIDDAAGELQTNLAWRGFRGTQAEAHTAGEVVTFAPAFPRSVVRREINNVLRSIYPLVFGVKSLEVTGGNNSPHVMLPADAVRIVDVRVKRDSITGWERVREWDATYSAPSEFGTGVTLDLYGYICAGYKVQVVYAIHPKPLVNDSDPFTESGLSERCKDIVTFGVQWRLAQNLDLSRLPVVTAESDELDANKQTGAAIQVANTFYKLHTSAIERERSALNLQYPARTHKVR